MIQAKNNYFYDSRFDDLTVRIKEEQKIYSEEIYNNIYIYYSEKDDSLVGAQILYLSKRANKILERYLPDEIYDVVKVVRKSLA